jgi:crotonobetainyl-CoA:carnitine CoA-transferase CaiB-like acyl-CoA transferase
MKMTGDSPTLMEGYRALDLTNEIGFTCGKILGSMGVDTIKVEAPGGDRSRYIPPFAGDVVDGEKSLYWQAFNTDKRSITLNLDSPDGQALFRRLATTADFVIESFVPGYLDSLGLGYQALKEVNQRIILTSITPFGQEGPYRRYKGSELIASAMSGVLLGNGDADRPPVREGPDSVAFLAGAAAAAGTMIAHYHRQLSGTGQHVDVSLQHVSAVRGSIDLFAWEFDRRILRRSGPFRGHGAHASRWIWACQDGFITWTMMPGMIGAPANEAISKWMAEKLGTHALQEINDWKGMRLDDLSKESVEAMFADLNRFFLTLTKDEIAQEGRRRGINASVIKNPAEIFDNPQLEARDYWRELPDPDAGARVKYPGYFFLSNLTENYVSLRAPRIGEHNEAIYGRELGLSRLEIDELRKANVI